MDAAKAAGVKHFVWSTLEDTRLALAGLRPPLAGSYTVPHFDAKAEVDAYMRVEVRGMRQRGRACSAAACRLSVGTCCSNVYTRLALAAAVSALARRMWVLLHVLQNAAAAPACPQLPGRCTALFTSVFYTNLLPGGSMDPQKQPDGSFLLFMPVGQAKVSRHIQRSHTELFCGMLRCSRLHAPQASADCPGRSELGQWYTPPATHTQLLQLAWCDPEDIGGVAAAVIAGGPERWADKAVGVAGEHASLEDVAGLLSRTFGKKVRAGWGGAAGALGMGTLARCGSSLPAGVLTQQLPALSHRWWR